MRRTATLLGLVLVGVLVLALPRLLREGEGSTVRWRVAPSPNAPVPPLECEAEGYPCSWDRASTAVFERTMTLASAAAIEFAEGGVSAASAWLREQPGVVDVEVGPDVAGFRLDGGRYMWTGTPNGAGQVSGPASDQISWLGHLARAVVPTAHAQVVGQDRFKDGKINQRDARRALLIDKASFRLHAEGPNGNFEMLRGKLEEMQAYSGQVDVRSGLTPHALGAPVGSQALGWMDYLGWEAFDLILLSATPVTTCLESSAGPQVPKPSGVNSLLQQLSALIGGSGGDTESPAEAGETPSEAQAVCRLRGLFTGDLVDEVGTPDGIRSEVFTRLQATGRALDLVVQAAGSSTDCSPSPLGGCETFDVLRAFVIATPDFFGQVYGTPAAASVGGLSMDRKLVYLNAPYTDQAEGLYQRFFGTSRSSTLLTRDGEVGWPGPAVAGALALFESLAEGLAVDLSPMFDVDPGVWGRGQWVRAREIVTLVDESGVPLEDGMPLPFEGILDDGVDDAVTLAARVEGLVDGLPKPGSEPATAWLEVDGRRVGPEQRVVADPAAPDLGIATFRQVPLGVDLTNAAYDVDVVVRIDRGPIELSESRYSVSLLAVDPLCDWSAQVSGLASGSMGGAAMATAYARTGSSVSTTLSLHHAPAVDAWALVPDPDTPLTLSLTFRGGQDSGLFQVENAVLNGRTFPLSAYGRGTVTLAVKKSPQPAGTPPRSGEWSDTGIASVQGQFSVDFDRIQSFMTLAERTGPMNVTGRFHWTAGCPNGLRPGSGGPDWGLPIERERAAGLVPREFLDSFPRGRRP